MMAVEAAVQMAAVAMGLVPMEVAAMGLAKRAGGVPVMAVEAALQMVAVAMGLVAMEGVVAGERDSPYTERVSLHGGTTRSHQARVGSPATCFHASQSVLLRTTPRWFP